MGGWHVDRGVLATKAADNPVRLVEMEMVRVRGIVFR